MQYSVVDILYTMWVCAAVQQNVTKLRKTKNKQTKSSAQADKQSLGPRDEDSKKK